MKTIKKTKMKLEKSQIPGWILESEACEMLGVGVTAMWKLRQGGRVTWSKLLGRVYLKTESIIQYLESNAVEAQ